MADQTTRRIYGKGEEPSAQPELPGSFRVSAMLMQDAVPAEVVQVHSGPNQVALFANPVLEFREEALVIDNNGHLTYLRRRIPRRTAQSRQRYRSRSRDISAP
jgi:hypothetical protein